MISSPMQTLLSVYAHSMCVNDPTCHFPQIADMPGRLHHFRDDVCQLSQKEENAYKSSTELRIACSGEMNGTTFKLDEAECTITQTAKWKLQVVYCAIYLQTQIDRK